MSHPNDNAFPGSGAQGLTKREYIAIKLHAALAERLGVESAAIAAVIGADQLLDELNKS